MSLDEFWAAIDWQLGKLTTATTADDVLRILGGAPGGDSAFFAGSGGDGEVAVSLREAGWRSVDWQASYYWCMEAPNGDRITYVEGDVYRGYQIPPRGEPS